MQPHRLANPAVHMMRRVLAITPTVRPVAVRSGFVHQAQATLGMHPVSSSSSPAADRAVIQSEVATMSAAQVLRYDNTSGITITAILAVLAVLLGVFILCILLGMILSRTNARRLEAFPYSQPIIIPSTVYNHLPVSPIDDPNDDDPNQTLPISASTKEYRVSLFDSAARTAGQSTNHTRTGSSGLKFPGPVSATKRRVAAVAAYSDRPSSSTETLAASPKKDNSSSDTVNSDGREITINMAGPQADDATRQAAEERRDQERNRRSVVIGGLPPAQDPTKRSSRYSHASQIRQSRLSLGTKSSKHRSRQRVSVTESLTGAGTSGNLSTRHKAITSSGAGMVRPQSQRWQDHDSTHRTYETLNGADHDAGEKDEVTRSPVGNCSGSTGSRTWRASHLTRSGSRSPYQEKAGLVPGDFPLRSSELDLTHVSDWAATTQDNLLDPLQNHAPKGFVTTR